MGHHDAISSLRALLPRQRQSATSHRTSSLTLSPPPPSHPPPQPTTSTLPTTTATTTTTTTTTTATTTNPHPSPPPAGPVPIPPRSAPSGRAPGPQPLPDRSTASLSSAQTPTPGASTSATTGATPSPAAGGGSGRSSASTSRAPFSSSSLRRKLARLSTPALPSSSAALRRVDSAPSVKAAAAAAAAGRVPPHHRRRRRGGAFGTTAGVALPPHHRGPGFGRGFVNPWPSAPREAYGPGSGGVPVGGAVGDGGEEADGEGADAACATGCGGAVVGGGGSGSGSLGGSGRFLKVAKDRKPPDALLATMLLLSVRPKFGGDRGAGDGDDFGGDLSAHWIGHATFVLELPGVVILTDPVWAARLGPLGPRRLVPPPCEVEDLPAVVDVCLLSSAGYDHFDKHAVEKLRARVRKWVVPLGVKPLLVAAKVAPASVDELDWWEETTVPLENFPSSGSRRGPGVLRIACTPAQSASPRRESLWCSYYLVHPLRTIFYCGGSGYRAVSRTADGPDGFFDRAALSARTCPAFREIRDRYGPCDVALLPMGGAAPRPVMSGYNCDAVDLLLVQRDLDARRAVAHRWGTFQVGEEGMLDPVRLLETAVLDSPISEHDVAYVHHGRAHRL